MILISEGIQLLISNSTSSPKRKRVESNMRLSTNLDKLIQEENKTNSRLDQVCRASDDMTIHF